MPAVLSDYARRDAVNGLLAVPLADGLTARQVAELLERPEAVVAERAAASTRMLRSERAAGSGLALLHAYEATHGAQCSLSALRKGPIPSETRDKAMLKIYRTLTGDNESTEQHLRTRARTLAKMRMGGGAKPSPSMRRLFQRSCVIEREELGRVGGIEKLNVKLTDPSFDLGSCVLLSKNADMDVRGISVGDLLWVRAAGPPDGRAYWYKARVRGFIFRCHMPPILIEFLATESGDTNPEKLPNPRESACRKKQTRPFEGLAEDRGHDALRQTL